MTISSSSLSSFGATLEQLFFYVSHFSVLLAYFFFFSAVCGDGGVFATSEACDGTLLGGESCASIGFTGGSLACTSNCDFDTTDCFTCSATDLDDDNDGFCNIYDNCPTVANPTQEDNDSDGVGNQCDNCLWEFNPDQIDSDGDGLGDVCDPCPNSQEHSDEDWDSVYDCVDNCPFVFNPDQVDSDGDGIGDGCDNCINVYNPNQDDADGDGMGDACDDTFDGKSRELE